MGNDKQSPFDEKLPCAITETAQETSVGELAEVLAPSPEAERRLLWKLDFFLIPTMGICYMLQYMDKLALSQATLLNLRQDLGLRGSQYTWCSAIFYFGYLAWSWPTSYLIVRLPLGKYLAISVFLWGGILMCHAACQSFQGLITARFFLGVGEAAVAPGFGLIVGMFYKRDEQPARQAAWFVGNCVANLIGGVTAWGIGNAASSIQSWRLLFLVLGGITSGYAIFLLLVLPDSPSTAFFLSSNERRTATQRMLSNETVDVEEAPGGAKFHWNQVWESVQDPQAWCLVLYTFCVNLANGGLTSFSAIIVAGFGYSSFKSLLLQMPVGAAQLVFLIITAAIATFIPSSRILSMILNVVVAIVGVALIYTLNDSHKVVKLVGLSFVGAFAVNIPLALSIISSNVVGRTKRSTVSSAVFAAYCVGNIVGPQFFLASEEPVYATGIRASLCGLALGVLFLGLLSAYYVWENRRRDAMYGHVDNLHPLPSSTAQAPTSHTDRQNTSFRYVR
ncbi:MFS transporter [Aspergillus aculeatinus CBS 121060]|uniref:MFS transporter n=1 Tax=Aspergillus aculeatinus CBS 121060 TaxID=1448322 RepID=A0ACD1H5Z8_9EURO|nr:MFS transporter [Aspergillus aculeatinus CBS 121060]RAH68824.1 MFS transporter [Aspergillus aculeatinus CBS 121060]